MTISLPPSSASHQRRIVCEVGNEISSQVAFWEDPARVRGFVAGTGAGKTYAGAIEVLRQPPSVGLVVAPTYPMLRDASQRTFFELCPEQLIRSHNRSEQRTELINGSTILWRTAEADRLRGPNIGWIWVDEAAYLPRGEECWKVLMSRLRIAPGRCWITTTPAGQNWLYRWFITDDNGYTVHTGRTQDNPHNLRSYYGDLVRQYAGDPDYAAQELEGEFVDLTGSKRLPPTLLTSVYADAPRVLISHRDSIKGLRGEVYTLPSTLRLYQQPIKGRSYVIGADCAEGLKGGDDSSAVVLDKGSGECVAILSGEYEPAQHHPALLALLSRWYNSAPALVERNNHGHAVIAGLARHAVVTLNGPDGRPGWQTTALSKAQAYGEAHAVLLQCQADGLVILSDRKLKEQLASIDRVTLRGPGKGRVSKVDDEAIAWVLAQQARRSSPVAQARSRKAMANMLGRRRS